MNPLLLMLLCVAAPPQFQVGAYDIFEGTPFLINCINLEPNHNYRIEMNYTRSFNFYTYNYTSYIFIQKFKDPGTNEHIGVYLIDRENNSNVLDVFYLRIILPDGPWKDSLWIHFGIIFISLALVIGGIIHTCQLYQAWYKQKYKKLPLVVQEVEG